MEYKDQATQTYIHAFDFHYKPKPIIHILENNRKYHFLMECVM